MYMYVQYMSLCKNTLIIYDAGMDMLSIYIHNYTHVPTYGQYGISNPGFVLDSPGHN